MLKLHEKSGEDTVATMADIGRRARTAARPLAVATTAAKNAALAAMADAI
ncbi:MAG: gamma-glutamyl-phosphate reductase, partial [Mesorhizobium sp.]